MIPDKDHRKGRFRAAGSSSGRGASGDAWRKARYYFDRAAVPCAVLVISLLLTFLAWRYVLDNVEAGERVRFDDTVRAIQDATDRRTEAYLDAMIGARSFYYASESVRQDEWMSFVEGLDPEERFEGLQALGYMERVPSDGGERFPITLIGPSSAANQDALSYDWYPSSAHRAAMDQARDMGSPRATGKIYISTEAPASMDADLELKEGYAVYLPVYREGELAGNVAERRQALQGFIFGFFMTEPLLGGVSIEASPTVDYEVYDGADLTLNQRLYEGDRVARAGEENPTRFTDTRRLNVTGREWSLFFASLDEFDEQEGDQLAAFVLVTGVAVSLLLFGITAILVRSRLVAEQAGRDLADANGELQATNRELEAFSYSVSHDLRAPLRSIDGFSQILLEDYRDELDEEGRDYLGRVRAASQRMGHLIDDLLELSRVTRSPLNRESVDLSGIAASVAGDLKAADPDRSGKFIISEGLVARGDARLLRVALENLLNNAWKFTSKESEAVVEFGGSRVGGALTYYVRDNGAGFDQEYAGKLFGAFQRLHGAEEFEGTGVGLATVARVIRRHGGEVWAEGKVGGGATFYFTLERGPSRPAGESR